MLRFAGPRMHGEKPKEHKPNSPALPRRTANGWKRRRDRRISPPWRRRWRNVTSSSQRFTQRSTCSSPPLFRWMITWTWKVFELSRNIPHLTGLISKRRSQNQTRFRIRRSRFSLHQIPPKGLIAKLFKKNQHAATVAMAERAYEESLVGWRARLEQVAGLRQEALKAYARAEAERTAA